MLSFIASVNLESGSDSTQADSSRVDSLRCLPATYSASRWIKALSSRQFGAALVNSDVFPGTIALLCTLAI
jgi:hypothetical protein